MLDSFVDGTIAELPHWVSWIRQQTALNKQQGILNDNEIGFVFGFVQRIVIGLFHACYHEHYNEFPNEQQLLEDGRIVGESLPQIR